MARPVLHYLSAALLGLLGFGLSGGCAESESMLVIRGVIALEAPDCVAEASASTFHVSGVLDPNLTKTYVANLQVASQLAAQGNSEKLRAETARVTITGAEVKLKAPNGSQLSGGHYTVTASGSVDPAQGDQAGFGVVFAPLVPDVGSYIDLSDDDLPNPLVVEVQVFGSTVGGQDVWSNWFTYPIYIDSLVYFPSDAMSEDGLCTEAIDEDAPCRVGQDDPVPCSVCTSVSDTCRQPAG